MGRTAGKRAGEIGQAVKVRGETEVRRCPEQAWERLVECPLPQTKPGLLRTPHKEERVKKGGVVRVKISFREASPAIP